jgi:hypothetical protein
MSEEKNCGQCGVPLSPGAPEGLCPACLLKRGFEAQEAGGPAPDFTPPSPEDLARFFRSSKFSNCWAVVEWALSIRRASATWTGWLP